MLITAKDARQWKWDMIYKKYSKTIDTISEIIKEVVIDKNENEVIISKDTFLDIYEKMLNNDELIEYIVHKGYDVDINYKDERVTALVSKRTMDGYIIKW